MEPEDNEQIEESTEDEPGTKVEDSILNSVKKLLGIEPDYTEFDVDIMLNINASISTLSQIGVGPYDGYIVTGADNTYDDYLGEDCPETSMVKMYLFYKTKLGFDPPQSSIVAEAIKEAIKETEWRLNVQVDPMDSFSKNKGEIS